MNVSVIMDCYGRGPLLERTLWLLDRQTYGPIEVVLVDDGAEPIVNAIIDSVQLQRNHINVILGRERPAPPRAGNMALRQAYEAATGDFIITSSPETMPPVDAIERMLSLCIPHRRSVPILYCLSQAQTNSIDDFNLRSDLHFLQDMPSFWATISPSGVANADAHGNQHHMQFSGQPREDWERTGFLPPTERYGEFDESWLREQELSQGRPPVQIDVAVYHQWHERILPWPQPVSVRLGRLKSSERIEPPPVHRLEGKTWD